MAAQRKRKKRRQPGNVIDFNQFRGLNINIGVIIFVLILIYLVGILAGVLSKKSVNTYQVRSGSLSVDNTYRGLIIRDEEVQTAASGGYINYFAREGYHVACGELVYTLDQTGSLSATLSASESGNVLSANDLSDLRSDIISYAHNYSEVEYSSLYDFSYEAQTTILKLSNSNILNSLSNINTNLGTVNFCYAPKSGIVVYSYDGYENLTVDSVTFADVEKGEVVKTQNDENSLLGTSDITYKLITSEDWSIIIETEYDRALELEEESYVEVTFQKSRTTSWGKVTILQVDLNENIALVQLSFNNSMITFAKERYLDIEIQLDNETGLKIPNSAIAQREFFLIPQGYLTKGGNSNSDGFFVESYDEDGNRSQVFRAVTIYGEVVYDTNGNEITDTSSEEYVNAKESNKFYYVDVSQFNVGEYIIKVDADNEYPELSDTYAVSKIGTLIGVYNVNQGFADFKEITILYSNEEYSIIKSNSTYGLLEYDYIVLDADETSENDFIYE